jgi:hypothetical protein
MSTIDALEKDQVLQQNYIEFATEALSLGRLFTQAPENFLKFFRYLSQKRGKELVDVIADTTLWYNFGLVPTLEISKELSEWLSDTSNAVDLTIPQSLRGKFTHYHEESRTAITARSVVHLRPMDLSGLSGLLLRLIRLGLSPTPGQVWEAVPFSFLIDKISKTGTWLDAVDTFIKLNFIYTPTYFVHSLSLNRDVTDEVMSLMFDKSYIWEGELTYNAYLRDVSVYSPRFQVDPYGIMLPQPPVGWATTSSLLWKGLNST